MTSSLKTTDVEARAAFWTFAASVGVTAAITYLPLPVHSPAPKAIGALKETLMYGAGWASYLAKTGDYRSLTGAAWWPLAHAGGMALSATITFGAGLAALYRGAKPSEYGEGDFAGPGHLSKMELDGKLGPVLGQYGRQELRPREPRHTMIVAPTRSGKTAGVIIPTLYTYPGTVVVIDPKSELYAKTAKARAKIGPVYQIDWSNPASPDCWSPVAFNALPKNPLEIERLCERISAMFFPPTTGASKYWDDTARRNFAALLMFEIYQARDTGREPRIGQIVSSLASFEASKPAPEAKKGKGGKPEKNDPFGDHLLRMAATADLNGYPNRIRDDIVIFANLDPKERSAHLNSLITGIQLLRLEAVQESTRSASFTFDQLQQTPSTVYIRFPQQDAKAFGPLTALFFESLFAHCLDNPKPKDGCPILIAADEFPSLPKIPLLLDFLAKGAGNGSHIAIVVQDFAQIEETYGRTGLQTILTNCTYTIAFQQNNAQTAELLSKLVGKKTRFKKTKSGTWLRPFAPSVTEATEGVPVIAQEDWGRVPFGKQVVLVQSHLIYPVLAESVLYYKHRRYRKYAA